MTRLAAEDEDGDNAGGTGAAGNAAGAAHILGGIAREIEQHHVLHMRRVDAARCPVRAHQHHLCAVHGRRQEFLRQHKRHVSKACDPSVARCCSACVRPRGVLSSYCSQYMR